MKIAIIPARGGSKRIPRKNIRRFAGKPIIAWPIEAALDSNLFDRIIVSTDDAEIRKVAENYGAEVPYVRPPELSDDFTGTNAVVKHAIHWLSKSGQHASYVCCIYATAPFVRTRYLREGFDKLVASGKSYSFTVASYPFPIQRALRINSEGCIEAIWPENIPKRSQDLEASYHDAGQFYWGRAEAFLADITTYSSASVPIILPRELVQDIDTPEDWFNAELIFQLLREKKVRKDALNIQD